MPISLPKIKLEDVAEYLAYQEKTKTINDMNEAIQDGVTTLWGQNNIILSATDAEWFLAQINAPIIPNVNLKKAVIAY